MAEHQYNNTLQLQGFLLHSLALKIARWSLHRALRGWEKGPVMLIVPALMSSGLMSREQCLTAGLVVGEISCAWDQGYLDGARASAALTFKLLHSFSYLAAVQDAAVTLP